MPLPSWVQPVEQAFLNPPQPASQIYSSPVQQRLYGDGTNAAGLPVAPGLDLGTGAPEEPKPAVPKKTDFQKWQDEERRREAARKAEMERLEMQRQGDDGRALNNAYENKQYSSMTDEELRTGHRDAMSVAETFGGQFRNPSVGSMAATAVGMAIPGTGALAWAAGELAEVSVEAYEEEMAARGINPEVARAEAQAYGNKFGSFLNERPLTPVWNAVDEITAPIEEGLSDVWGEVEGQVQNAWDGLFGPSPRPPIPPVTTQTPAPRRKSSSGSDSGSKSKSRSSGQQDPGWHGGSRYSPSGPDNKKGSRWASQTDRSGSSKKSSKSRSRQEDPALHGGSRYSPSRNSGFQSQTDRSYSGGGGYGTSSRGHDYNSPSSQHGGRTQL